MKTKKKVVKAEETKSESTKTEAKQESNECKFCQ